MLSTLNPAPEFEIAYLQPIGDKVYRTWLPEPSEHSTVHPLPGTRSPATGGILLAEPCQHTHVWAVLVNFFAG